jgi:hypothetical protein
MGIYQIYIYGKEDGSFIVEYFNPQPAETIGEKMITTFRVWGLSVIRSTPALMRATGFKEEE